MGRKIGQVFMLMINLSIVLFIIASGVAAVDATIKMFDTGDYQGTIASVIVIALGMLFLLIGLRVYDSIAIPKTEPGVIEIKSSSIRYMNIVFRFIFGIIRIIFRIVSMFFEDNKYKQADKQNELFKFKNKSRPNILKSITPWRLILDSNNNKITLKKRNWYFMGVNTQTFNFGKVRNVLNDEKAMTSDIHLQVYAGSVSGYYFPKKHAKMLGKLMITSIEGAPGEEEFIAGAE